MWWLHTASGQQIKALRRRAHSEFFLRSSRKLGKTSRMDMCWVPLCRRCCADFIRACLHGSTVWQSESTFLFEVYIKRISSNHVASLSHTISVCQYMLSTYESISTSCWTYVLVQVMLHTWTLWWSLIGRIFFGVSSIEPLCVSEYSFRQPSYHKTTFNHMVPYGW